MQTMQVPYSVRKEMYSTQSSEIDMLELINAIKYHTKQTNDYKFEFELKLISKPSWINIIEYEYEIYIESVPFYLICLSADSDYKQKDLFNSSKLKNDDKQFNIEIVVRIVKFWPKK